MYHELEQRLQYDYKQCQPGDVIMTHIFMLKWEKLEFIRIFRKKTILSINCKLLLAF